MKALLALLLIAMLAACGGAPTPVPEPLPVQVAEPVAQPAPVPAAEPPKEVEAKPAGTVSAGNDASNIEYDQNDMITNAACDYAKGTVSFTLKNNAGKDLNLYHGEVPQSPNSLKISINGMQFNSPKIDVKLDCGDSVLKSMDTRSCTGENVQYRKPETLYNQKGKNRLLSQYQGASDVTFFECFAG